jgi:hypothetical protein
VLPGAQPKLQQAVADRGIDARCSERILIQIQDGIPYRLAAARISRALGSSMRSAA